MPDHYADDVSMRVPHPSIPAEALARQARLHAALGDMEASGPSLEPASLQALRAVLAGSGAPELDSRIAAIVADDLVEEAAELLRASRRQAGDRALAEAFASRLAPLAAKAQQRRSVLWRLDTRRLRIRLAYAKEGDALGFDDGDVHAIFLHAFRLEGLPLHLDLGKRPRFLLNTGLPLPAGAGGLAETMDAVLKRESEEAPAALLARLNQRLPPGLRIHHWDPLPGYAAEVSDLALLSHWRWEVAPGLRYVLEPTVTAFLAASTWPWDRGAAKSQEPLDLRQLVPELHWDQDALCFATRMGAFQAFNPMKLLGAILGLDPASIVDLVRTAIDLKADARLGQSDRFEPKLKNMYEDAVLLGGGSNIVLVDEDDDEPIHLG